MTELEKEYYTICAYRKIHPLPEDEYCEVHHILPRSCGGMDLSENLVRLTPEEHYRCHSMLPEIFKERGDTESYKKMIRAKFLMASKSSIQVSEEEYGALRRAFGKISSEQLKGKPSVNKGKKYRHRTEDEKRRISMKLKGRPKSEQMRIRLSNAIKGHPVSEETRKKISETKRLKRLQAFAH